MARPQIRRGLGWEDLAELYNALWRIGAGPELAVRMAWACVEAQRRLPNATILCTRTLVVDKIARRISIEFMWMATPKAMAEQVERGVEEVLRTAGLAAEVKRHDTGDAAILRAQMALRDLGEEDVRQILEL